MRTTLDVADDVLAAARSLATAHRISIGSALSELARQGLRGRADAGLDVGSGGFPVFVDAPMHHPITSEAVADALDDV